MTYDKLTKSELIFLIEGINERLENNKKSLKKYHKTQKGIDARKRAYRKYYDNITKERVKCSCGKGVYKMNMKKHILTNLHLKNLSKQKVQ